MRPGKEENRRLAEKLNKLLEIYSMFYRNSSDARWKLDGETFADLDEKFELAYSELLNRIHEAAISIPGTRENNAPLFTDITAFRQSTTVSDSLKSAEYILKTMKDMMPMDSKIPDPMVNGRIRDISAN